MTDSDPLLNGIVRVIDAHGGTAGTGFVTHEGLVVTCAHVVELARSGPGGPVDLVRHATGARWRGTVLTECWCGVNAQDVAVIAVPDAAPDAALPLGSSGWAEGEMFRTFGFPVAKPTEGLPGRCEVLPGRTAENGFPVLTLRSQEVSLGFSGAPVWDAGLGVVVGMIVSIVGRCELEVSKAPKIRLRVPVDPGGRQTETAFMIPAETIRARCPSFELPRETPYRELKFFDREHERFYFGRDAATREVLARLGERGLVILVGTSGSGKSSLVRAGLEKGLKSVAVPGLAGRKRCLVVPGPTPMLDLLLALSGLPGCDAAALARCFGSADDALTGGSEARERFARSLVPRAPRDLADAIAAVPGPSGLLLIVDQFERLYTECVDEEARDRFIDTLLALPDDVGVIIALRADFYGHAMRHLELSRCIKDAQVTLLPMDAAELRQAIEEPTRMLKRRFQPGLVETLIADVRGQAGALPLLELTLADLWDLDADEGVLTRRSYEVLGYECPDGTLLCGVAGAIARTAEEAWRRLTPDERRIAPSVFIRLVAHETADDQKRIATFAGRRAWLAEWDDSARAVVAKFVDARLLVTKNDPVSGQPVVELAHEALLHAWPTLRRWLTMHGAFARWYSHEFAPTFRRWLERDGHADFLLPESVVSEALRWQEDYPEGLAGRPGEYVRASAERLEHERARERERSHRLAEALRSEETQRLLAQRSAEEARSMLWATRAGQSGDRALALALALAAGGVEVPSASAQQTLADLAYRPGLRRYLRFGHAGRVWAVAQGGDVAVSGSADRDLIVWDLSTGHLMRTLRGHTADVRSVALSADGRVAVSGSSDRTVIVWDTRTGRVVRRFEGHADAVLGVALSPAGGRALSGSADRTAIVWDVESGKSLRRLEGHGDVVAGVALSADGRTAVSCSSDRSLIVWDAESGELLRRLQGHGGAVWSVSLSPDGSRALSGSADRTAIVWDVGSGKVLRRLNGHTASVWGLALSPDGRSAVSGSSDHTVIVWDSTMGEAIRRIEIGRAVNAVAFDAARSAVLCAGDDHSLTAWHIGTGERTENLTGHAEAITAVALSGDGSLALSGSAGGELLVWDTGTSGLLRWLEGHEEAVKAVALSADGRTALSVSSGGVLLQWDTGSGEPLRRLEGHGDDVVDVALSADGRTSLAVTSSGNLLSWDPAWHRTREGVLLSVALSGDGSTLLGGSSDGAVYGWDTRGGGAQRLDGHRAPVRSVALSGDGRTALSVDDDHTVILWDMTTREGTQPLRQAGLTVREVALSTDAGTALLRTEDNQLFGWDRATGGLYGLAGHEDGVSVMALSSDGRQALSSDGGHGLAVWDVKRGDLLRAFPGHDDAVTGVALSRDGRTALSGSADAGLVLWDVSTGEPVATRQDYPVNDVALSADGARAIAVFDDLDVVVWDTRTGDLVHSLSGHTEAVTSVALSADGGVAVSGSVDQKVILWDVTAGDFVRRFEGHNGSVHGVALGPDGRRAVSGSDDASVIVWDTATGGIVRRFGGHQAGVSSVALSHDGMTVVAASADGTVSVCDVATGARHVLVGHAAEVLSVAFTADERMVLSGAADGLILLWDIATRQPIRRFEGHKTAVLSLSCGVDAHGMTALSGSADGRLLAWRIHSRAELICWTYANRHIHEFTCAEREAHLIEPPCDELGNPPPARVPAGGPPLTVATMCPTPARALPARPAVLELRPDASRFDAIQHGRRREWRIEGRGRRMTVEMVAEGIDLEPALTLYGPGRTVVAVGESRPGQRSRIGPVELPETGAYTVVAEGRGGSAGGYTITLTEWD